MSLKEYERTPIHLKQDLIKFLDIKNMISRMKNSKKKKNNQAKLNIRLGKWKVKRVSQNSVQKDRGETYERKFKRGPGLTQKLQCLSNRVFKGKQRCWKGKNKQSVNKVILPVLKSILSLGDFFLLFCLIESIYQELYKKNEK